ncbi:transducin beta-like protein 2 [Strongylocentrotus purpuratus]|uniref:Transducin beta-like protein 2 n=1 Tax=Strongylocentrotus purpuratus TaxID=7668 RepID=A0A7M7P8V7_STRPU|nr:transducin beta-like protein 2 [Strongylocentrotus purpuratus]
MADQEMMEKGASAPFSVVIITLSLGAVILLLMIVCGAGRGKPEEEEETETNDKKTKEKKSNQANKKQTKSVTHGNKKSSQKAFTHPLLASSLKEHSHNVLDLDFSINGKYVASCSEDRTVRVWSVKEFKEKEHKCVRGNVEYDHATNIKFSPDCKSFITSTANGNCIRVFKLGKREDSSAVQVTPVLDFPKSRDQDILSIGVGSNASGSFIMVAYTDTTIQIWNTKGEVLASVDTHHMNNNYAAVSPCGRFVASCGFTPDVKVWEVVFSKAGEFGEVRRAMELKGHKASVYSFSFNLDSSRMATVSKDGTWKLWDTDVEYAKQQDPYLLLTGQYPHSGPCLIALSPDAYSVAIAQGTEIWLYSANAKQEEEHFQDVHSQRICKLGFDPSGKYLVSTGDRFIRIFHNIIGLRALVSDLEAKLKKTSSGAMKERLNYQIKSTSEDIDAILNVSPTPTPPAT